jgi:hypothetical protein
MQLGHNLSSGSSNMMSFSLKKCFHNFEVKNVNFLNFPEKVSKEKFL